MKYKAILLILFCIFSISRVCSQSARLNVTKARLNSLFPDQKRKDTIANLVTIDLQSHAGTCRLANGVMLKGQFAFAPYLRKTSFINGDKLVRSDMVYFISSSNESRDTIPFHEIEMMSLAGKDSSILTDQDSTVFRYFPRENLLLRLRAVKPVNIYDDLRFTDELITRKLLFWKEFENNPYYSNPVNFYPKTTFTYLRSWPVWELVDGETYLKLRFSGNYYYEWNGELVMIRKWADVTERFPISPYILEVAETFYKNQASDIMFGLVFTNADDKMSLLPFFSKAEVRLANGQEMKGYGYIQPFNPDFVKRTGYFHFFDGTTFMLLKAEKIRDITYRGRKYIPVFDNFNKCWYLCYGFDFNGSTYRVAEGLSSPTNKGFFDQEGEPVFTIFRQKPNGKFVVENHQDVWNAFFQDKKHPGDAR